MERRGFLKMLATSLGVAAVVHPLGDLVAGEIRCRIPAAAKFAMPADSSFFIERVMFTYAGAEDCEPRLLIGSWELETGLHIRNGEQLSFDFRPHGGYQLDPDEKICLMGPKNTHVSLHGIRFFHPPAYEAPEAMNFRPELLPYAYWLRV